jgi:uncharacterized protein YegL
MADPKQLRGFTAPLARPLPVLLLADVSGSMGDDGKIDALNRAVSEMLAAFGREDDRRTEIQVGVITFGAGGARLHQPLTRSSRIQWQPMTAAGTTPLAAALDLATQMIDDQKQVPESGYRPTLVLVSDGQPTDAQGHATDEWKPALARLLASNRGKQAFRFAMAIGADADENVLRAFIAPATQLFRAHEARQIEEFFQHVTVGVTHRSRSRNPDSAPAVGPMNLAGQIKPPDLDTI